MKKDEILELLKAGATVYKTEKMNIKYGKVKRGSVKFSYKVNDETITEAQFESIRPMLGANLTNSLMYKEFKLFQL